MTNFWAGLTKSEITELIRMHKDVATMNKLQIEARKQEAAEALRTHLLEAQTIWLCTHLGDLGAISIEEHEKLGEEISRLAWQQETVSASKLRRIKAQAGDGYQQAQDAFKLLEFILEECLRPEHPYRKSIIIILTKVAAFLPEHKVEEFLPEHKS